jgi:3-oxoacid CoA-transferase subunit B
MKHTTREDEPRILRECTYPLTGRECVSLIVTDLAVIDVTPHGLVLREAALGWSPEEIQRVTAAPLQVEQVAGYQVSVRYNQ